MRTLRTLKNPCLSAYSNVEFDLTIQFQNISLYALGFSVGSFFLLIGDFDPADNALMGIAHHLLKCWSMLSIFSRKSVITIQAVNTVLAYISDAILLL